MTLEEVFQAAGIVSAFRDTKKLHIEITYRNDGVGYDAMVWRKAEIEQDHHTPDYANTVATLHEAFEGIHTVYPNIDFTTNDWERSVWSQGEYWGRREQPWPWQRLV